MKSPLGYTFRGFYLPDYMVPGLERYIYKGILPGDFLSAVLRNDLVSAVSNADETNLANLPVYIGFLYNEVPSTCWGSPQKVEEWSASGGLKGQGLDESMEF